MRKKRFFKKVTSFLLIFVMTFITMPGSMPAFADGLDKVETKITKFTITTIEGTIPDGYEIYNRYRLNMEWDAGFYNDQLKEGNFFNITLPDGFKFANNPATCNFNVYTPDGVHVVAKAVVTPHAQGGGNIKVTFTKYVEDKYAIKGTVHLEALFNRGIINTAGSHSITVATGSYEKTIQIKVKDKKALENELLQKWSNPTLSSQGYVEWAIRINHKKANMTNVVFEDELVATKGI